MPTAQTQSKRMIGASTLAVLGLVTSLAHAQLAMDPAVNLIVGTRPSGMTAGDFDNDGDMDLATTVDNPDRVAIVLNIGAGQYTVGPSTFLPSSSSPQDIVAGDLDGDGDIDLAVAVRDPVGSILIMFNTGAGTFMMGSSVAVGDRPRGLTIGDMDGDGDLDLASANRASDNASVMTNNGAGVFTSVILPVGNETRSAAFVDFDADGDLDLAVTNHGDRTVHTFTNNGGAFSPSAILFVGGQVRPDGMTSADLDGDGDDDLAVAVSSTSPTINQIAVFMNTGAGFIGPFNYATAGQNTSYVAAGDLNCDGAIDLAASNSDSTTISLLLNVGGGTFGAPMNIAAGVHPEQITAADFDGDGDADIAAANRDSNDVSVVVNQTCTGGPSCPADLDGDGSVGITDLLAVLAAWGQKGVPADFDGGGVGITDLLTLLVNWGPCP